MSIKTYITKKVSELNWTKVFDTSFKYNSVNVSRDAGASVLYKDFSSLPITNIEISAGQYSIENKKTTKNSRGKVKSITFYLVSGEDKFYSEVYCGYCINCIRVYDYHRVPSGDLTLKVIKKSSTIEVPLTVGETNVRYIYSIKLEDIGSDLAEGPIMFNGQVLSYYDYKSMRGNNFEPLMYYYHDDKLIINLGKDISEFTEDTISVCIDYSESGVSITPPCRIIPKSIGMSFNVVDDNGNSVSSIGGKFPNLDYSEGSKLYGILLAEVFPISSGGGSGGSSIPDSTINEITDRISELESTVEDLDTENDNQLDIE